MHRHLLGRRLAVALGALLTLGFAAVALPAAPAGAAAPRVFYVDCSGGNDANTGRSTSQPWRTITRVSTETYLAGDTIRFRAGRTCAGMLEPHGSGTAASPIVVNSYGTGAPAIINGQGGLASVYLHNVEGWEIRELTLTNTGPAPDADDQRFGVFVLLEDFGTGHHYVVSDVTVRDVNGCDCRGRFVSGGIVFSAGGSTVPTGFDGITVQRNVITHVDRAGIATFSRWQRRPEFPTAIGTSYAPMTNVEVQYNLLSDLAGDGLLLINAVHAHVHHNVVNGFNARSTDYNIGMYAWNSDYTVFEHNEVANGAGVGMAFGLEGGNVGTLYQYNFSNHNGGGFLYVCDSDGSISVGGIVRYNISQNDEGNRPFLGLFTLTCGNQATGHIYNNTFYAPTSATIANNFGTTALRFTNNIFVGKPGSILVDPYGTYDHNLYYNVGTVPADAHPILGNPSFVAPGTAINGLTAFGYLLRSGSPAVRSGVAVPDSGPHDYFLLPVPSGAPNLGAYQGPGV